MTHRIPLIVLFALGVLYGGDAAGQTRQRAATPQRPSFSNNAATTYPRSLELETGLSVDDELFDTPTLIKFGFTGDLEGFFGVSPVVRRDFGTFSDTEAFERASVGLKYRLQDLGVGIPAIAVQISSTEFQDFSFLGIYSQEFPSYTLDANLGLTFDGGTTLTGIATFSRTLSPELGVFAEALLENNFEHGDPTLLVGLGGSLTRNPLYVWDAALHIGVANAAFDVRLQVGVTANLGVLQR